MHKPLISLVTPVYNTKESWLRECFDSVMGQSYVDWEWILCDNGGNYDTAEILQEYQEYDSRITLCVLYKNKGGYKGIQEALKHVTAPYVALMDSDDTLSSFMALDQIVEALEDYSPDVLYTDEMITDIDNKEVIPFLKPDFNRNLLCFLHYWGHLTVYRSALIKRLRLRHCGGSYDYDLALRASEITDNIYHLPHPLYNYRTYPDSTSSRTRDDCMEGGLITLQQHLDLVYPGMKASRNDPFYKVDGMDMDVTAIPESLFYPNHLLKSLLSL